MEPKTREFLVRPEVTQRTVFLNEARDFKLVRQGRLVVAKGSEAGLEYRLQKERILIGRSSACDLRLNDSSVSALHAEVLARPEGYLLRDLDSTNGIFMLGHRVREVYLNEGSQFQVGNNLLRFEPLQSVLRIPLSRRDRFGKAMGASVKMREVFAVLEKVAPSDLPVLLRGETGTGKELLAEAIHAYSLRKNHPFVVLDCGAVPATLIEDTLFGHERGAFTGADSMRRGLFEEADGGTLFIDEIGELDVSLQPKLLRVLEHHEVQRVGGVKTLPVDVRVVAATHRNLRQMVEEGRFREDLLYRLSVVEVEIPPLRERPEDIRMLVQAALAEFNAERKAAGREEMAIDPLALQLLDAHPWPGNVRELRNTLERVLHLCSGPVVSRQDLMLDMFGGNRRSTLAVDVGLPYKESKARLVSRFEQEYLTRLVQEEGGNLSRAARRAGLARQHLRTLCRRYAIPVGAEAQDGEAEGSGDPGEEITDPSLADRPQENGAPSPGEPGGEND